MIMSTGGAALLTLAVLAVAVFLIVCVVGSWWRLGEIRREAREQTRLLRALVHQRQVTPAAGWTSHPTSDKREGMA